MIDPYKMLYLKELTTYYGGSITQTISNSTHIISYYNVYNSKNKVIVHPNWLLLSVENNEYFYLF